MIGDDQLHRTSDTARESQGVSAGVGEHQDPQPSEVRSRGLWTELFSEEGGPQAGRSRHRQISCETCCLRLEHSINDDCNVAVVDFGHTRSALSSSTLELSGTPICV